VTEPSDFRVLENIKSNHTANYAIHAKVIKHHNIAVIVKIKSVHHALATAQAFNRY